MEMSDPIRNVTDHKELQTDRVRKEDENGEVVNGAQMTVD